MMISCGVLLIIVDIRLEGEFMKTKRLIGHILILVGICIPLQAFTQISIRDMSSAMEYRKYQEVYSNESSDKSKSGGSSASSNSETVKKGFDNYNKSVVDGTGLVDPFVSDDYKSDYQIKDWKPDQVFGYLIMPSIDVKLPIRLDATYDHLDKGVAHVYGTSLPTGGKDRRSVIAGHRGWYRGIMLLNLGKVKPGDKVFIDRNGNLMTYVVKNIEIISPSEWEKLKPVEGKDMLTILSCHPIRPPSPYRMLVNCERLEDPVKEKTSVSKSDLKAIDAKLDTQEKRSVKVKYLFYLATLVGWILLIYRVWKIVKEFRNSKRC